ncbi:MAG: AsmA protein [Candidatus Azotimanducaceae bacterium]|jgi:AsmA protein
MINKLVIALITLPLLAFAILLIALDNPDAYQSLLTKSFHDETGLNLEIEGDINWRYWPPIAIDISGINIRPDHTDTSLARLKNAKIDIQVMPLLTSGKIFIDEIHIEGIEINALIDKQGKENWLVNVPTESTPTLQEDATPGDLSDSKMILNVSAFTVSNAIINYQDLRDNSHYLLNINTFTSDALRADHPANIQLRMRLEDKKANISHDVEMDGLVSFNNNIDEFKLENLLVRNKINQPERSELLATLKLNGNIDTNLGKAEIQNSTLTMGSLNLSFTLNASNIFALPTFQGKLSAPTFDAKLLSKNLNIDLPAMQKLSSLSKVSFEGSFNGTSDKITFENLTAKIDSSTIEGTSSLTLSPHQAAEFNLTLDAINLSDYMEPETTATNKGEKIDQSLATTDTIDPIIDSEVIPVSILSTTKINVAFNIVKLLYDDYTFNGVQITALNQKDGFRLNAKASGYGGEFAMQTLIRDIDLEKEPRGKITVILKGVNMAKLTEFDSITGTLAMDSSTQFTGNMLSEVLSSIDGPSNFTIADGTLNVTPIKGLAQLIDGIQGKTSSISTWPDLLPFKRLEGSHQFSEGIEESQQFSFAMENIEVSGKGGFDYFANNLNYEIEATLKENIGGQFTVNKNLADIRWPLHCTGSLDATATELCLADKSAVTKLVADLAKQAILKKGEDKLLEKIPVEYKDTAKKLLKGLFN